MNLGPFELLILLLICVVVIAPLAAAALAVAAGRLAYGKRVPCPYCAEKILPQAKVCRFCGREILPASSA